MTAPKGKAKTTHGSDDDEPMPFDDALRVLLAAPPQHRTAKDKPKSKRSKAAGRDGSS
jgi:hypothetical protein